MPEERGLAHKTSSWLSLGAGLVRFYLACSANFHLNRQAG